MALSPIAGAAAVASLLPALVAAWRRPPGGLLWVGLAIAVAGVGALVVGALAEGWRSGLSTALWLTVVAVLVLFALLAACDPSARRLSPLLLPYLVVLALLAALGEPGAEPVSPTGRPAGWLVVHIAIAVLAYGLVTLAAISALAVWIRERALRRRLPSPVADRLPAIAEGERLLKRMLLAAALVLAGGVATGVALALGGQGGIVSLDHKTTLSVSGLALILVLLAIDRLAGLGGRRTARGVLVVWLLLTLAYPGVKFVADVLLSRPG